MKVYKKNLPKGVKKCFALETKKNIKRIKLSLANYVIMTKETDNSCILTNKTSLL